MLHQPLFYLNDIFFYISYQPSSSTWTQAVERHAHISPYTLFFSFFDKYRLEVSERGSLSERLNVFVVLDLVNY